MGNDLTVEKISSCKICQLAQFFFLIKYILIEYDWLASKTEEGIMG